MMRRRALPPWFVSPGDLARRLRAHPPGAGPPLPLLALDVSPSRVGLAHCPDAALGLAAVRLFGSIEYRSKRLARLAGAASGGANADDDHVNHDSEDAALARALRAACAETDASALVIGWPLEVRDGSRCAHRPSRAVLARAPHLQIARCDRIAPRDR